MAHVVKKLLPGVRHGALWLAAFYIGRWSYWEHDVCPWLCLHSPQYSSLNGILHDQVLCRH
eukprot:2038914-Amphidinium_carterae.1